MGWWPFGPKGDVTAKKLPGGGGGGAAAAAAQQQQQQAAVLQDLQIKPPGITDAELAASLPKPTSIFEFGQMVPVGGEVLRGMCAGSDPDAIHACTWTIEQAQGRGRERKARYRVEF